MPKKKPKTYWAAFKPSGEIMPAVTLPSGPWFGPVVAHTKTDLVSCGYTDIRRVKIVEVKGKKR